MNLALQEALRDCVQDVCDLVNRVAAGQPIPLLEVDVWKRGEDGYFRPCTELRPDPILLLLKQRESAENLPSYHRFVELAKADPVVGPHIDCMVGTASGLTRFEVDRLVMSVLNQMPAPNGRLVFDQGKFEERWSLMLAELSGNSTSRVTLAPLPNLTAPFPLTLAPGVLLDHFTDEEANHCIRLGLIESQVVGFPLIQPTDTVGIRCVGAVSKVISRDTDERLPPSFESGSFGRRPPIVQAAIVDDVLTALRLFKEGELRCPGILSTYEGWLAGGHFEYSYRHSSHIRFGRYVLEPPEVSDLQHLWTTLSSGVLEKRRFLTASLRRFKLALDRELIEDRIVDFIIAAESLFLYDADDPGERGELAFRLALRASLFVESPRYDRRQVFDVMRRAYRLRSRIVHGGTVKETRLPDKADASLTEFTKAVEGIMRDGLRKGLVDPGIGDSVFWDDLFFGKQDR